MLDSRGGEGFDYKICSDSRHVRKPRNTKLGTLAMQVRIRF